MNGVKYDEPMSPQNFLYGCVLEAGKEVVFHPDEDELEHQLDLRMACVDPSTKDQLHTVEVEGHDAEGQKVKAVLVTLKPSTLPSVCLGGFMITPPAVLRLKAGSGPVHISGQHLIMVEPDQSFDEEDEEEEEEEEEEEIKVSNKRPASSPASKPQKKIKMEVEEEDEDDEDEDDEEDDEESEAEETPVKAKPTPSKQKKNPQNGKSPAPSTPATKQGKSPKVKAEKSPKTPTPKSDLTIPEIKAKVMEAMKKGVALPKVQARFENFMKHGHRVSDPKVIADLWNWRQTLKDDK